jgi:hypothetical protein
MDDRFIVGYPGDADVEKTADDGAEKKREHKKPSDGTTDDFTSS